MGRKITGKGKKTITITKEPSIRKAIVIDRKNEVEFVGSAVDKTFGDITINEKEPVRRHARVPKEIVIDHLEGGQVIITRKDRKGDEISQTAVLIAPNIDIEVEKLRELERKERKEVKRKLIAKEDIPREELRRIAKIFDIETAGTKKKSVLRIRVKRFFFPKGIPKS